MSRISTRKARRLRSLVYIGQMAVEFSNGTQESADRNIRALLPFGRVSELLIATMVVDRIRDRQAAQS